MERGQDIALGLTFVCLGLAAAWGAGSYSGAGGTYPRILGLGLAAIGALVAARAVLANRRLVRKLIDARGPLGMTLVGFAIYIAVVVPLGFYTASVLLMLGLPVLLGFRRPFYLIVTTFAFVIALWVVFSVVLEKPLPAEIWSAARSSAG